MMFYTSEAEELRAFIRDKLGFSYRYVGGGWLIFDIPEAELGCHPSDSEGNPPGRHENSFYWRRHPRDRGAAHRVEDEGYGLVTYFEMPGGVKAQLYERKY